MITKEILNDQFWSLPSENVAKILERKPLLCSKMPKTLMSDGSKISKWQLLEKPKFHLNFALSNVPK